MNVCRCMTGGVRACRVCNGNRAARCTICNMGLPAGRRSGMMMQWLDVMVSFSPRSYRQGTALSLLSCSRAWMLLVLYERGIEPQARKSRGLCVCVAVAHKNR
jgi:hypothetical protein